MPYIKQKDRELIDEQGDFTGMEGLNSFLDKLDRIRESHTDNYLGFHPGTLNYILTRICDYWVHDGMSSNVNYEKYNAVIGVLECAKQEFYRRQVALYEDEKCRINGDVYPGQDKRDPSA